MEYALTILGHDFEWGILPLLIPLLRSISNLSTKTNLNSANEAVVALAARLGGESPKSMKRVK